MNAPMPLMDGNGGGVGGGLGISFHLRTVIPSPQRL
jgi:hypothetical protein